MTCIHNTISFLICYLALLQSATAQFFSGKITYRIHYEDKFGSDEELYYQRYEGNRQVYSTDGCNQRTDIFYEDQLLRSTIYQCDDSMTYLLFPSTARVLQHSVQALTLNVDSTTEQQHAMNILGVACDRSVYTIERSSRKYRMEYFTSAQYYLDEGVPFDDQYALPRDQTHAAIPLAMIRGGDKFYQAIEATRIEPMAEVPEETFRLPEWAKVVRNGTVLEDRPTPRIGYGRWYGKLQASLRYPKAARKELATGRVTVMFTITEEGRLEAAEVVNQVDAIFKRQVLTFLSKSLVRWVPGKVDGKPVSSTLVLPVDFKLFL